MRRLIRSRIDREAVENIMGHFYSHVLVCGASQEACAATMKRLGRRSIVAPAHRTVVTVCDAGSESLDLDELDSVAFTLAHHMKTATLAVLNHDDDLFLVRIFGPEGFKGYCRSRMLLGGAYAQMIYACGVRRPVAAVWLAFARPYRVEVDRHEALVRLLDLPPWSVGMGYRYLSTRDLSGPMRTNRLIRT